MSLQKIACGVLSSAGAELITSRVSINQTERTARIMISLLGEIRCRVCIGQVNCSDHILITEAEDFVSGQVCLSYLEEVT